MNDGPKTKLDRCLEGVGGILYFVGCLSILFGGTMLNMFANVAFLRAEAESSGVGLAVGSAGFLLVLASKPTAKGEKK
jgi:hypothetical protein